MNVLKILIRVDGDTELADRYVVDFDPNFHHATGYDGGKLATSAFARDAKQFASAVEALEYWKSPATCACHGTRPWDGKPNRPLTAYNVTVEKAECQECGGQRARVYPDTSIGHAETCRKCKGQGTE